MRVIKLGIISIVIFFLLLWLVSLLFPSRVIVSRAITIHETPARLKTIIGDPATWPAWNKLLTSEQLTHQKIGMGSFVSDQVKITVIAVGLQDTLLVDWQPARGRKLQGGFVIHGGSDSTVSVVQWYFEFRLRWYPWEKFGSIVFDKQLGPLMESSLEELRLLTESKQ